MALNYLTSIIVISNYKIHSNCSLFTISNSIWRFFSRHYDKMLKSLSKFVSKNPQPTINLDTQITDERIVKLSADLGYNLTDDIETHENSNCWCLREYSFSNWLVPYQIRTLFYTSVRFYHIVFDAYYLIARVGIFNTTSRKFQKF